jgi:hypothetical protein
MFEYKVSNVCAVFCNSLIMYLLQKYREKIEFCDVFGNEDFTSFLKDFKCLGLALTPDVCCH